MKTIYIYLLDTMAEWEIGNILQAVSMEKDLCKTGGQYQVKTFSLNKKPVKTIGGLSILPDLDTHEIDMDNIAAMLLPGAENWSDPIHNQVIDKALSLLEKNVLVGAICGATLALANRGVLNTYRHTSNALDYLQFFSSHYEGQEKYVFQSAVADRNLVTAGVTGGLEWAKLIIENLEVYPPHKIDLWYKFFSTGKSEYYLDLMS